MVRVLFGDESRGDYLLTEAFLTVDGASFHVDWEQSCEGVRAAVARAEHDVYLVSASIGGGRGMALVRELAPITKGIVLLVLAKADTELEVAAVRDGAADVLVYSEMTPNAAVRTLRKALARHRAARVHAQIASPEPLPDIASPALLYGRIEGALARSRLGRAGVAVVTVRLEREHSPPSSWPPAMLLAAVERVRSCVREVDTVGLLVGDLVILVEDQDNGSQAARIADRVLDAMGQPIAVRGSTVAVTTSVGVAAYPEDGETVADLLHGSGLAAGSARDAGGNTFRFRSSPLNQQAVRRLLLQRALDGAIARGEFSLQYQPQVDLRSGLLLGVEALLRWNHPDLGAVSPVEFVPVLEASDRIN
ncbi:MAG: EAL domain-containing protein, partial [Myxococcales bacterium]